MNYLSDNDKHCLLLNTFPFIYETQINTKNGILLFVTDPMINVYGKHFHFLIVCDSQTFISNVIIIILKIKHVS